MEPNIEALADLVQAALNSTPIGSWTVGVAWPGSPQVRTQANARLTYSVPVLDGAVLPWDGHPVSPHVTQFEDVGLGVRVYLTTLVPRFDEDGNSLPFQNVRFIGRSNGEASLTEGLEQALSRAKAMAEREITERTRRAAIDRADAAGCGAIGEHVVPALKAAPDATVKAYESPAYDWLGDLAWSAPGLGVYQQNCDDSGHPVFYASEVAAMVASAVAGTDETDALTGRPWLRAFASLEKAAWLRAFASLEKAAR